MISLFALALLPSCVAERAPIQSILNAHDETDASSHVAGKTSCALLCHLPPWHQWRDAWASKCDLEESLFLDTDQAPLRHLKDAGLSGADLVQTVHRATLTYEKSSEHDKIEATRYKILHDDANIAQGVLFGAVVDLEESSKQGKVVTTPWQATVSGNEARCIAVAALDEVRRLLTTGFQLKSSEYIKKRGNCSGTEAGWDNDEVETRIEKSKAALEKSKAALEKVNLRTKMIAEAGGKAKLLQELDQRLPPASTPCNGTLEECLPARLVNVNQWHPPAAFEHQYGNVMFVGCNYAAMTREAVVTAMQLVAPGGKILVSGFTPQHLSETFGMNSFDVLSNWTQSTEEEAYGPTLTVFTPP